MEITMAQYWLLITLVWIGAATPQYINTAGPDGEALMDPLDFSLHYPPLPYGEYSNTPQASNIFENLQNDEIETTQFYQQDPAQIRKRRTPEAYHSDDKRWRPYIIDKDKTYYIHNNEKTNPFILGFATGDNSTSSKMINAIGKRNFSPWGGKRANIVEHNMWTWKRASGIREPNMPKRVRFSPWGGKRSGQMIFKPGVKGSKIILSASVPELTRIVSNYSPNEERIRVAGVQLLPSMDKRHPLKILALTTQMDERSVRDSLPFKAFIESLPKAFKPGRPYVDVNLNKEGKRKVKFSAWGGKRSPPIIGPIWTPASRDIKDSTLDTIVLIRNNNNNEPPKTT